MICGKTLQDGISNEIICDMTNMKKREKLLRKQKSQWFGLVEKMNEKRSPGKQKNVVAENSKKADQRKDGNTLQKNTC